MTADEVLNELIAKGLVTSIQGQFFINGRVNEVLAKMSAVTLGPGDSFREPKGKYWEIVEGYPEALQRATSATFLKLLYQHCDLPTYGYVNNRRYIIKSQDRDTRVNMENILKNADYNPVFVIRAIKEYYEAMEFPKAFKNFLASGDFETVYDDLLNGKELPKDDLTWR